MKGPQEDQVDWCPIPITIAPPDLPIGGSWTLYEGDLNLSIQEWTASTTGTITLTLEGSPEVTFNVMTADGAAAGKLNPNADKCTLAIPSMQAVIPAMIFSSNSSLTEDGFRLNSASGVIDDPARISVLKRDGTPESLGRIQFYLLNFPPYHGTRLYTGDGDRPCRWFGRASFRFAKWEVVLDQSRGADERFREAAAKHRSVANHVGVLRRIDGKLFSPEDGAKALDFLYWFFCFTGGSRCAHILAEGLRHTGFPLWRQWGVQKADPARNTGSWFNDLCPGLCFGAAEGLYGLWSEQEKREWLKLALGIYVAANHNSGGIELALANSQIVLEMLTWVVLTEENTLMSDQGFDSLSAADKIRALLFWLGVSGSIPSQFGELRAAQPNVDAPQATTGIRNRIIHASRASRADRAALSNRAIYQAWQWNLWVVELTLLKLAGYCGPYRSRTDDQPQGHMWNLVPWHPERTW